MKSSKFLGKMIIFTLLLSVSCGQSPMSVLCSIDWFMVSVQPLMLNNHVYIHFHELLMGHGCPATYVQPHSYQFTYRVTECGIRSKVISQDMILYSTEMYYISKGTSSRFVIPLSCTVPQKSPWLTMPSPIEEASGTGIVTQNGETCYEVFTLSQCRERSNCDCPPCVFNGGLAQAQPHQEETEPFSSFVDVSRDWVLHSDDLIEPM
ncbi:placenta-specific protein 1 [Erinaceus europaeus]|uniref:Placenta-specific protein 1 n=1 Tax=Erinaceus europaeus TaxID=9365 RepID=A0A1S2ZC36_ERIEU|nr:placenta-specific protein 1 [Erinaceus europaeus]XP_060038691.1 placenta-specific protein 1 [Erinaceus europaeus]XP_060038692.1 placenta-specific protein 1 [Erinaceus europaeus]XP_060038693.1 placenta-specific protein 1 [Erinaceus europaeus]XP_060038694.1 placenta-specific protein 1 [Erinaceus europaeus]XP_060038696.1 placenta-specific protein 1 [Erinaceus europaeus]